MRPLSETPAAVLGRTARGQLGLFTVAQARAAGYSIGALKRLVAEGACERVLPRVLAVAGAPRSWDRSLLAGCLWAGEGTAVSHRAAAAK
jgi:hypothetical protein